MSDPLFSQVIVPSEDWVKDSLPFVFFMSFRVEKSLISFDVPVFFKSVWTLISCIVPLASAFTYTVSDLSASEAVVAVLVSVEHPVRLVAEIRTRLAHRPGTNFCKIFFSREILLSMVPALLCLT